MTLNVLAAGASKGLVTDLQPRFTAETGVELNAVFVAAGAVRDRFLDGEPCDVLILTAKLLDQLGASGLLDGPARPIGIARTGIAVPDGHQLPDVGTGTGLRDALLAARGIYVPDPRISTAGIHFMRVLRELGIEEQVLPHLRPFPNGATAMHNLAQATEANAIGCTQITEIKYTPGLTVVGPLPEAVGLATTYSAAVAARSTRPDIARRLVTLLTGPESRQLREAGGFEMVSDSGVG